MAAADAAIEAAGAEPGTPAAEEALDQAAIPGTPEAEAAASAATEAAEESEIAADDYLRFASVKTKQIEDAI